MADFLYETPDRHTLPDDFRAAWKCGGESWSADFQKGYSAYNSGDYANALRELLPFLATLKFFPTNNGKYIFNFNDPPREFYEKINANPFNKYLKGQKLKCVNISEGKAFNFYKRDNELILNLEGLPIPFEIGRDAKKNGNREQYIVNFGFYEIFIDFEGRNATLNALGLQSELSCY